jgi:hypothetical protein
MPVVLVVSAVACLTSFGRVSANPLACQIVFQKSGSDTEFLWGHIIQARKFGSRIYLVDYQLHTVHVLNSDGEYIGQIAREGDGPGEVRNPTDVVLDHDGNVGVCEQMPAQIEWFDEDEVYVRTQHIRYGDETIVPILVGAMCDRDQVICQVMTQRFTQEVIDHMCIILPGDPEQQPFACTTNSRNLAEWDERAAYKIPKSCWTVAGDGSVAYVPERNTGRVGIWRDGENTFIDTGVKGQERPPERIEEIRGSFRSLGVQGNITVSKLSAAFSRLFYGDSDRLFARLGGQITIANDLFGDYIEIGSTTHGGFSLTGPHDDLEGKGFCFGDGTFLMVVDGDAEGGAAAGIDGESQIFFYRIVDE